MSASRRHREVILSPGQAADVCMRYQKLLRLQDWRVEVVIVPKSKLRTRTQAQIDWLLLRRSATISLLRPADYRRLFREPQDMELDIVHELCHLHLLGLGVIDGTPEDIAQEQAIEALSEGIVTLARAAAAA